MTEKVWIHRHMEEGHRYVFDNGDGYDCPKDRFCWQEVSPEDADFFKEQFPPGGRKVAA